MEKHLVPFGNSLGLVIERSICKLLGLTKNTPLEISTDGRRILIEPLAPRPSKLEQLDLEQMMLELARRWGMDDEMHGRIHPRLGRGAVTRCLAWAALVDRPMSAEDALYAARYRVVLERKRAGAPWNDAINAALAQFPDPGPGQAAASGR